MIKNAKLLSITVSVDGQTVEISRNELIPTNNGLLYKSSDEDILIELQPVVRKVLYHCTTPKKAKRYHETGSILAPVRGFDTLQAAMLWCMKTNRTVIYEIEVVNPYKLPDHHNKFGGAWWSDCNISINNIKCVVSAGGDGD